MRIIIIALAILMTCHSAKAQAPSEYNLKLYPAEVDLLGKGLGTQPYNDAFPLINKMRQQVIEQQQLKPVVEPPKADDVKPEVAPNAVENKDTQN